MSEQKKSKLKIILIIVGVLLLSSIVMAIFNKPTSTDYDTAVFYDLPTKDFHMAKAACKMVLEGKQPYKETPPFAATNIKSSDSVVSGEFSREKVNVSYKIKLRVASVNGGLRLISSVDEKDKEKAKVMAESWGESVVKLLR